MIIVTGAAGFIGSALVWQLNQRGITNINIVDDLGCENKWQNLAKLQFSQIIHTDNFLTWLEKHKTNNIRAIVHLGAISATTETNVSLLVENNINYSIELWNYCSNHRIPYIYASSASTYGTGSAGFSDDHDKNKSFTALNPYGFSKSKFDSWVLAQLKTNNSPNFWAGLRFFNVYGPNEYHKGAQSSVIPRFVEQIKRDGRVKLFKSYKEGYSDGEQKRDFVYIKDCTKVIDHLLQNNVDCESGIYNVGTATATSFNDLAFAIFKAMKKTANIDYVDMPENLKQHYQYYTQAQMNKLQQQCNYSESFTDVKDGIEDYVTNYLLQDDKYL